MIELINGMPIAELFLVGIFALVSAELVKWTFNIKESSIGLHSSNTGQLMKTRYATLVFTVTIFISNIIAFIVYNQFYEIINSTLEVSSIIIDGFIVLIGIVIVWVYLKKNHYSRRESI